MRTWVFIIFIIMIIIFLNELKNITRSFYNINHISDVANINIKNNCNNIYCEAETARFNLSKNTMDLLLPNDNFNSKTYIMFILLICVLLFLNFYYKFITYNNKMLEYISKINGEYFINYISYFPYILLFTVIFMISVMIIRRYAPTGEKGYKAYFNVDNKYISANINSYNINVIHNMFTKFILFLLIIYVLTSKFSDILEVDGDFKKKGDNYYYISQAYIIAVLFTLYLMINIINIVFTFKDNNEPILDSAYFKDIFNTKYSIVKELFMNDKYIFNTTYDDDYLKLNPDDDMFKNYAKNVFILNISLNDLKKRRDSVKKFEYEYVNYIYYKINANDKSVVNFDEVSYYENLTINEKLIDKKYNINIVFDNDPRNEPKAFIHNIYKTINKIIKNGESEDKVLMKINDDFNIIKKYENILDEINNIEKFYYEAKTDDDKEKRSDEYLIRHYEYYQFAVNYICVHIIKYIIFYIKNNNEKIINLNDKNNEDNVRLSDIYIEQIKRVEFVIKINELKNLYNVKGNEIKKDDLKTFNKTLETYINKYIENLNNKDKNINQLFTEIYDINKNEKERDKSFTADISYNSLNSFYENYFKIINYKKLSLDYYVGDFYIKNIESCLIYIFIVLILILFIFCIFILPFANNVDDLNPSIAFLFEIVLPLCVLLIFIVYVYIFMSYNTKYNMYFIYGIINSSYNRDLTHLNNVIMPFLKLHDMDTTFTKNYYEHYIISNVLASILNGNIDFNIILKNNNKTITSDHLNFEKKYESYNNIKLLNIKFKPFNDKDTANQEDFKKYYMKTYENIYDYKNFKKEYKKDEKLILDIFYEKNKIKTNIFSNIVLNNINDNIKNKINEIINERLLNIENSSKNTEDKSISPTKDDINNIKEDIDEIIKKYDNHIYYIIKKCTKLFNQKNFLKDNNKYDENIIKLFKFELTNNNLEAIPYKFILNINTKEDYDIFFKDANVNANKATDDDNTNEEIVIDKNIKKIVENFIIINYHIAYNTHNMISTINIQNEESYKNNKTKFDIINNLNTRHIKYNKKLYGLLIENFDVNDYDIDETFFELKDLDKLKKKELDTISDKYKILNYNYNNLMLYESKLTVISNNYLKNIIKSIYYQLNKKDINFEIEQNNCEKYETNINKKPDTETNIIENILQKSNYIKGEGLFINYVINIIFIAIIYNIGYNM